MKTPEQILEELIGTERFMKNARLHRKTVIDAMKLYAHQPKEHLTDEQIDAMFPDEENMILDYKRQAARQVRDLLQGKGGEGV